MRGGFPGKAMLVVAAGLLVAGAALQLLPRSAAPASGAPVGPRLAEVLPRAYEHWTVSDEPLGPTEAVKAAAVQTLQFDDYVYRRYERGGRSFSIYAAYWGPDKMPVRLVASHTPDRCWTENGMRCTEMRFREKLQLDGHPLLPAEYRVFLPPGGDKPIYVLYWHVVGGRIYDYGARFNAIPHPWLWLKDAFTEAKDGRQAQLFVRVVSFTSIPDLCADPDFRNVFLRLANQRITDAVVGANSN